MSKAKDAGVVGLVSVAFFFVGLAMAFFFNLDVPLASFNVFPELDLLFFCLAILVFSMLFFGRLTPLFFFLVGANQVVLFKAMPLVVLFRALPVFLAGFVGTLFGMYLLDDLNGTDNLYAHKMQLLKWFAVCIALAVAIGFLNQRLVEANAALLGAVFH